MNYPVLFDFLFLVLLLPASVRTGLVATTPASTPTITSTSMSTTMSATTPTTMSTTMSTTTATTMSATTPTTMSTTMSTTTATTMSATTPTTMSTTMSTTTATTMSTTVPTTMSTTVPTPITTTTTTTTTTATAPMSTITNTRSIPTTTSIPAATAVPVTTSNLHPIVLVPGDGGSQLQVQLNKDEVVSPACPKQACWYTEWLNFTELSPQLIDCLADNLKLNYDSASHTTYNQPGVNIYVPGFGDTCTIEYRDPSAPQQTPYFAGIVAELVNVGYVKNVNLRGAPYDFRKAPNEICFNQNLIQLIEDTYYMNQNKPVVLIGHSLGCIYILVLLNRQSQAWKDKYIKAFISVSGPYGGAAKTMMTLASGYNFEIQTLSQSQVLALREVQRSMPSTALLMPYYTFWDKDEILVTSITGEYSVTNYGKFMNDINFPNGVAMRQDTAGLLRSLKPPNVQVFCLYGYNVSTPQSFIYNHSGQDWYDFPPSETVMGAGDGSVNLRSLQGCNKWVGKQNQAVTEVSFVNAEHGAILFDPRALGYIIEVLESLT